MSSRTGNVVYLVNQTLAKIIAVAPESSNLLKLNRDERPRSSELLYSF